MRFRLHCTSESGRDLKVFYYDNTTGLLHDEFGEALGEPRDDLTRYVPSFKAEPSSRPITKHNAPRVLKIQFGLSCNYSCSYCLQKGIERPEHASLALVPGLVAKIDRYLIGQPDNIQLWGGEPLVYFKAIRELTGHLKARFPVAKFSMVTNGSLLTHAINDWIVENDVSIALSHDGPGQRYRGPDRYPTP